MNAATERTGLLLVNLGTPDSPAVPDVRRFLREFLSDPRVVDISPPARWLVLHLIILPFRSRLSAAVYRAIWTPEGSPLLAISSGLRRAVAQELGPDFAVELGMRYGSPSIAEGLGRLREAGSAQIVVLPLFPQYSASTSGSTRARVQELSAEDRNLPPVHTLGAFYDHPRFIDAYAAVARGPLAEFGADHLLFSYHGLPERQIRRGDPSGGRHCLARDDCCATIGTTNRDCYRAQCFATTRALAAALEISAERWSVSFQSRMGWTRWIQPHTDRVLPELARRGVKRLAVVCPSFVADCLETLEEIGIRLRRQWEQLGSDAFLLVPCLNTSPVWVRAVADMVRQAAAGA